MLLNIKDKERKQANPFGKSILNVHTGSGPADIDLTDFGFSTPSAATGNAASTQFDLIDINDIKDEEGNSYYS